MKRYECNCCGQRYQSTHRQDHDRDTGYGWCRACLLKGYWHETYADRMHHQLLGESGHEYEKRIIANGWKEGGYTPNKPLPHRVYFDKASAVWIVQCDETGAIVGTKLTEQSAHDFADGCDQSRGIK